MFADRLHQIKPFRVMEVLARAGELEAEGHDVIHLEVGEPDFATATPIVEAGRQALLDGNTKYTQATGLGELRARIASYYAGLGVSVDSERIVVTSGASGGLTLLVALLLNPGDEILITDPGYPCNEVFAQLVGGCPGSVNVSPNNGYQPTLEDVQAAWSEQTKGVLFASPANPTGTMMPARVLSELVDFTKSRDAFFIMDEIYQGLVQDDIYRTALEVRNELYILNSFSKYFGMTGWRLGWVVVPESAIDGITRLAQNLFICPSTPAQHAALAAFDDDAIEIHDARAEEFERRCQMLYRGLLDLGFHIPVRPQGAFYLYVDVSHSGLSGRDFCRRLLDEYYVAVTPGEDFGDFCAEQHVRFAFTTSMERIELALGRVARALEAWR